MITLEQVEEEYNKQYAPYDFDDPAEIECYSCGKEISADDDNCPLCGYSQRADF